LQYILLFFIGVMITLFLTPQAIRLCYRWELLDHPTDRKVHKVSTPLAGGLVLFPVTLIGFLFSYPTNPNLIYFIIATTGIFAVGLWDDLKGIHFSTKFIAQIATALLVVRSGILFDLDKVYFFQGMGLQAGYILSSVVTVVWIVGITNAVNLIDGVDGLAAGLSLNAFAGIGALSLVSGSLNPAVHCIIMVGGILGFLRYNIFPARTFLGDSGSLLLGFTLAVSSIMQSAKTSTFLVLVIPVLFLAIPTLDTSLAFSRRAFSRKNPFRADREHLHHYLLDLNFTTSQVLGMFYGVSASLGILGLALAQTFKVQILALALLLVAVVLAGLRFMQIYNMAGFIRLINIKMRTVAAKAVGSDRDKEERWKRNMAVLAVVFTLNILILVQTGQVFSSLTSIVLFLFALGAVDLYLNKVEFSPRYEITRTAIFLSIVVNQILIMGFWQGNYHPENFHVFGIFAMVALLVWFLYRTGTFAIFLTDPVDILALYLGTLGVGLAKHFMGAPSFLPFGVALGNALVLYAITRAYLAGYKMRSKTRAIGFAGCVLFLICVPWLF